MVNFLKLYQGKPHVENNEEQEEEVFISHILREKSWGSKWIELAKQNIEYQKGKICLLLWKTNCLVSSIFEMLANNTLKTSWLAEEARNKATLRKSFHFFIQLGFKNTLEEDVFFK